MRKRLWKCGAALVCCILLAGCGNPGNQAPAGSESLAADGGIPEDSSGMPESQAAEGMIPENSPGMPESRAAEGGISEGLPEMSDSLAVDGGIPEGSPEMPESLAADGGIPEGSSEMPESLAADGGIWEESPDEARIPEHSAAGTQESAAADVPESKEASADFAFTICFAGDINLDESWATTLFMDSQENGIYDCISPELIEYMNNADIMCLNNEFAYSTGGAPLEGKKYTFRANPERVEILNQLGVDAVTLANNHIYDYGKEALLDTFAVLEDAEIPFFGAGRTLEEAMAPLYIDVGEKTVALVGASRAEKYRMTPQATETEPGILRCYDTKLYREAIAEARANADFCIAFVHWGTEYSYDLEQVQLDTGKEYLDAGADAVIGAHSHCLQGMEYYDGKPIIYSLGNYWFNNKTLDTMMVQLHFCGNEQGSSLQVEIVPAVQSGCRTVYAAEEEEQRRIFDFLESISVNVEITDEGIVRERPQ